MNVTAVTSFLPHGKQSATDVSESRLIQKTFKSAPMESSLFNRLQATLLALVTAGLFVLACLNLSQERHFQQPDDGVWWREVPGGLKAEKVLPDMPGQRAGIDPDDLLTG